MGRTRRRDRHLPACMYLKHGAYYFQNPKTRKWDPLGSDLGLALAAYVRLIGGAWSGRTLGDVIDRYRVEVLPLKGARARVDQSPYLDRLKRVFGDMLPDAVTKQHCYRYIDERKTKEGVPARSAALHEISLLGHIFTKANRWGVAIGNPVRNLEKEPKPKRMRYVTDAELETVKACATERMRIAIELAYLTGLRRGDVLRLTRANVSEQGIAIQTKKTGAPAGIGWTARLRAAVEDAKRLSPQVPGTYLVRTRGGGPYSAQGFAANWKRAMSKAVAKGIEPFTFHDLRRKNADDSQTLAEAQARLGHASAATTSRHYRTLPIMVPAVR